MGGRDGLRDQLQVSMPWLPVPFSRLELLLLQGLALSPSFPGSPTPPRGALGPSQQVAVLSPQELEARPARQLGWARAGRGRGLRTLRSRRRQVERQHLPEGLPLGVRDQPGQGQLAPRGCLLQTSRSRRREGEGPSLRPLPGGGERTKPVEVGLLPPRCSSPWRSKDSLEFFKVLPF